MNRHENETPEERERRVAWYKIGVENGLYDPNSEETAESMLAEGIGNYINAASSMVGRPERQRSTMRPRPRHSSLDSIRSLEAFDMCDFLNPTEEGESDAPRS